ncbi:hypothetical protein ACGTJS_00615 [Faucicola mancuniensis]|uniref:hypothetical protein n=1 Tax=Faucicola mancuniensis TaxID=1309795 RepID=UPI0028EABD17|nr:hypothetical protein [uncultured Moraxella sp.]
MKTIIKTAIITSAIATLTGCATTELLNNSPSQTTTRTTNQKTTLINDDVVAFGKPATPIAGIPSNSVVIVGEKHSYVLTQGGDEVAQLFTNLDSNYIKVTKPLDFFSKNNDGHFSGTLALSYAKLKSSFHSNDYDFVLRNKGTECTTDSDTRMNAQRFCFEVPVSGGVYPAVNNLALIQSKFRPLSKPYQVSIYTYQSQTTTTTQGGNGANAVAKLVALPFALAFDVVTLPVQVLASID